MNLITFFIRSIIINFLEQSSEEGSSVAYLYCNYKERNNQTATNLVACVLKQLLQTRPTVADDAVTLYQKHLSKKTRPCLDELNCLLQSEVRRFSRVFVVIDALDECTECEATILLHELRKLLSHIRLLVLSRHVKYIERELHQEAYLEIFAHDEDIERYAKARIQEQSKLIRHLKAEPTLRDDILQSVVKKAQGMYVFPFSSGSTICYDMIWF